MSTADTPRPRSRRDRPAKTPLSEAAVVAAGARVLRREGLDAVTMRRVAQELDTGAASLYVYVDGRDTLLRLIFDAVAGAVPIPRPDPATWRAQLIALLTAMLDALESHPGLARVSLAEVPTGPNAMACADGAMGLLLAGGVAPDQAAWALDALFLLVTANAAETIAIQEREAAGTPVDFEALRRVFTELPADRYPHIAAFPEAMVGGTKRGRFAWAVDTFLDGLLAGRGVQGEREAPTLSRRPTRRRKNA